MYSNMPLFSPQWPQSWTFGQYLHADKEDCCNMFFNSLDCVIKDSCTDTLYTLTSTEPTATSEESCESRLFHPTTDFQSCTNRLVSTGYLAYPMITIPHDINSVLIIVWITLKAGCGQA